MEILNNKRKRLHLGLWIAGLLVVSVGIFSLWVSYHYKGIIMQQLPPLVAKNTNGLYRISLGDISINILTRKVTLRNVRFEPDSNKVMELKKMNRCPQTLFSFIIPEIHIAGIQWENLAASHSFDCKFIIIDRPAILINGAPKPLDSLAMQDTGTKKAVIESLSANKIDVIGPDITYHFVSDSAEYTMKIKGGKVELSDWKIEPGTGMDTGSFAFAKTGIIAFDTFSYTKKGSLYNFTSGGIAFSSHERNLIIKRLAIKLVGTRDDFYKQTGYQKDIYDLLFPALKITALNWKALMNDKQLLADNMEITNPSLELYFSRLYPVSTKSKVGNYPHQLIRKLGLKLSVKDMLITGGHFKYTEMNKTTEKEGVVRFEQVSGTIQNVTNIDSLVAANDKCIIKLKGKYMNSGDISATFMLLLSDPKGYFTVDGTAKNINAKDVNQPATALASTEVTEFHMSHLDMHVEGNETYGKGKFTMLYDDLKVTFLKQDGDNDAGKKGKGSLSFLTNTLVLYPANPMEGKNVREITTFIQRDPHKGFFNLIWKSIFMGAKNTALRSPELVKNLKETVKPEKPDKKKGLLKRIFGKKKDRK